MSNSGVIIALTIGVMFMGLLYGATNFPLDFMVNTINQQTDAGIRSEESFTYLEFMFALWRFSPIAILLGLVVYTYELSKGSNLDVTKFFEYSAILYISSFVGIIFMWGWSMSVDLIFDNLLAQQSIGNVNPMWDQSWVVSIAVQGGYILLAAFSVIAILLMVAFPVLYQRDNTFFEEDEGGEGGSTATNALVFQPKQW